MIRTRQHLVVFNSAIVLTAMLLVALSAWQVHMYALQMAVDSALERRAQSIADLSSVDLFVQPAMYVQVAMLDGTLVARSENLGSRQLPLRPPDLQRATSGQTWFETVEIDGHRLRRYEAPWQPGPGITGVIQVGMPLDDVIEQQPGVAGVLAAFVAGVCLSAAAGWLLARIALGPVEQVAAAADAIVTTTDLAQRAPLEAPRAAVEPVRRLTRSFNAMLLRLQTSAADLEKALSMQRQFVADASHELRTPLTSLLGNVDFLTLRCLEDCPRPAVEQHQEVLRDLGSETRRMTSMVNDLLLLARADAQQHLSLMPVELEPILQTAYRQARGLSEDVGVRVIARCAGIQVMADPDRLLQLLLILLDNAVRYTPPGGEVTLTGYSDTRDEQPGVRVEVSDTGPGIPVEERLHIFERFYRLPATRTAEGAGLGLAVARWIAQEHGTELNVRDNQPVGSVFELWLPALPDVHA